MFKYYLLFINKKCYLINKNKEKKTINLKRN